MEEENEAALVGLIVFGAEIYSDNKNKITITSNLLFSSIREFFKGNKYLFSPDYINNQSEGIWHIAVRENSINLIQCIDLKFPHKPNLWLINSEGVTPLDLAVNLEHFEMVGELTKLYNHVIDAKVLLRIANFAIWNLCFKLFEILIKEFPKDISALIDSSASSGSDSILHILIIVPERDESKLNEKRALVLLFLDHFPQIIESRDQFGRTPCI